MDCTSRPPRPPRPTPIIIDLLLALHTDLHVELFGAGPECVRFNVKIARIPQAASRETEALAEDCFELMLPPRFRQLYFANKLLATGTARPLLPSVARAALVTRDQIAALNAFTAEGEEVMQWAI